VIGLEHHGRFDRARRRKPRVRVDRELLAGLEVDRSDADHAVKLFHEAGNRFVHRASVGEVALRRRRDRGERHDEQQCVHGERHYRSDALTEGVRHGEKSTRKLQ
jgi:hypothetical protein